MIDQMKPKQTLKAAELQDGDIICFQRGSEDSESISLSRFWMHRLTSLQLS